jgi:hypothetical protein
MSDSDGLDVPNCPTDLTPLEPVGDVREVVSDAGTAIEGTAWWRCPTCGLTRIA